jgi:transcription elongation factor GreA-like protein
MVEQTLLKTAHARQFDTLEERWMAELEAQPIETEPLLVVAAWLIKVKEVERAEVMLAMLLEALEEHEPGQTALEICEQVLEWFPEHKEFRRIFARQMGVSHPQNPATQAIAEHSGLLDGSPLAECLKAIHVRLPLEPGTYAIHRARRLPVRIDSFNGADDTLVLSNWESTFDTNLRSFLDQYENLAQDDFRALRVFDQDALAERAVEDPDGVVMSYLRSVGRSSTFREFREAMQACVVAADEWKAWWQTTKVRLIRNPLIDVGEGAQPKLTLRQSARDFSAMLIKDFDFADKLYCKPALLLSYCEDLREGVPRNEKVVTHFWAGLTAMMHDQAKRAEAFLAWLCMYAAAEAVGREAPEYDCAWLADEATACRVAELCAWEASYIDHLVRIVPHVDAEWPARFIALLPYAPYGLVERIMRSLAAAGEGARVNELMARLEEPEIESAELYAWLWRAVTMGEPLPCEVPYDVPTMTLNLLKLVQQLSAMRKVGRRNIAQALASLRRTIGMKKYSVIARAFSYFPAEEAASVFHTLSSNTGLSPVMRAQLYQYITRVGTASGARTTEAEGGQ